MASGQVEATRPVTKSSGRSLLWRIRIVLAVLMTLSLLPYSVGRTILVMMLTHAPEFFFITTSIVVICLINLLNYDLAVRFQSHRGKWKLCLVLVLGWIGVAGFLAWLKFSDMVPKTAVAFYFIPATIFSVWLSWMFFIRMSMGIRMLVTFFFLIPLQVFVSTVRVDGLSGEGNVDFAWRSSGPAPVKEVPVSEVTVELNISEFPEISEDDFPQFLGLDRTAVIQDEILPGAWQEQKPEVLWRHKIGAGWCSFAVVDQFVFTLEQREDKECVVCYELDSGNLIWIHEDEADFKLSMGGDGPRTTPSLYDGRVYTVGATGTFNCLNALNGELHWSKNLLEDHGGHKIQYGVSASPLVIDDLVIVAPTGTIENALVAYDRISGEVRWTSGNSETGYGSPQLFTINGLEQIVIFAKNGLEAYNIEDGRFLWEFPWRPTSGPNCSQPVMIPGSGNELIISTGYNKGAAKIQVVLDDSGNWNVNELWQSRDMKCKFTTPVIIGEYLYGLDNGIMACISVSDGKKQWKKGRYGHGQILQVNDHIVIQKETGGIVIMKPDPENLIEVNEFDALKSKTWNNPVMVKDKLLVRNAEEAICFDYSSSPKEKEETEPVKE